MTNEDTGRPTGEADPSPLRPYLAMPAQLPEWDAVAPQSAPDPPPGSVANADNNARLPPYLLTGGRARPIDDSLEIEAQVMATRAGRGDIRQLSFENRDIVTACREPLAVAEVAVRLGLHLGVTRVLVGDLVTTGHLAVRRPEADPRRRAQIIERVIRGLQDIP
jgi:hypothetical protein